jgi:hypothetical protein
LRLFCTLVLFVFNIFCLHCKKRALRPTQKIRFFKVQPSGIPILLFALSLPSFAHSCSLFSTSSIYIAKNGQHGILSPKIHLPQEGLPCRRQVHPLGGRACPGVAGAPTAGPAFSSALFCLSWLSFAHSCPLFSTSSICIAKRGAVV